MEETHHEKPVVTTRSYHWTSTTMAAITIVTILSAGKYAEKLDYSYFAGGNTNTLERVRQFLEKNKYVPIIDPNKCTLGHLPQINENLCSQKNVHKSIHSSFIIITADVHRQVNG